MEQLISNLPDELWPAAGSAFSLGTLAQSVSTMAPTTTPGPRFRWSNGALRRASEWPGARRFSMTRSLSVRAGDCTTIAANSLPTYLPVSRPA